ncbi:nicotinate phosphoribosyltransferase [Streptomyces sp. WAC05374]|uniref:nicotinate phosphoribosyltransferase n=1 Tax=Streptomyces sp. WAC05374 TaxID=2487420 RepID=UPI000F868C72|nr:nicotinate phosphoribosyltransferase [Streptomyces sp. WAC05374]RST17647.1 nicotinate phosphoribosyltransferase [Streptomyces sp. WAC05374]TDF54778.1 nicotinate phosphoribosyltransferase [Streptomyces sp. WAC05374]TDF56414.1 nicotinate phosphoribosyltransferase [Streptomyces sp. WAC05374]
MSRVTTTDLYEVTMAMSYLREGMVGPATFSLFVRDLPPGRGFLVCAGLEAALDHLAGFRVTPADAEDFAAVLHRPRRELEPLVGLAFRGEVRAVPEGRVVLAGEPLMEVTAPLPQAQLVETYLLNQVSHQTTVASKAVRCVLAAAGRPVVDFSLRRTHGPEAGMQAARAGAMAGFAGTSNVAAATRWGMPASGTMAHSYIEAFPDEEAAFRAFARAHPGPVTFLVDTYDTLGGVATAARVLADLHRGPGCAIRLDSGDLGALARQARAVLDAAGLRDVAIIASGGLDEYGIDALVRSGAPVDVYAVGTRVGTSADTPYLDSAYKLVEYDGRPVMKLSSAKATAPGRKQVFRVPGRSDLIALWDEPPPAGADPLLRTVMRDGRRTGPPDDLAAARARLAADLATLSEPALRVDGPRPPRPLMSRRLSRLTADVRGRLRAGAYGAPSRDGSRGLVPTAGRDGVSRGVRATKNWS